MEIKGQINFETRGTLGDNGYNSVVLRGYDPQLATELAFKRITKESLKLNPASFFEESQKIQSARHPNVVEIKYACADSDNIWLAMPLYKNGSLQALIDRRVLTTREVVRYGIEILTALQHIHRQKMVHLDVKPANILLSDSDTALLADFGCSRIMDENFLVDPIATYPLHQVPERFKGSKLGLEADIYQTGLTLYRLCNGDSLFFQPIGGHKTSADIKDDKIRNKVNEKIKNGKYPDRTIFLPHVPQRLRRVICKAIEINPDDRYRSAADFVDALSEIDAGLDWQFDDAHPPTLTWTQDLDSILRIQLTEKADGTADVLTTKTTKLSGNTQRSVKHCGTFPTKVDALKRVAQIAKELDGS